MRAAGTGAWAQRYFWANSRKDVTVHRYLSLRRRSPDARLLDRYNRLCVGEGFTLLIIRTLRVNRQPSESPVNSQVALQSDIMPHATTFDLRNNSVRKLKNAKCCTKPKILRENAPLCLFDPES
jgi:hypothetical protein